MSFNVKGEVEDLADRTKLLLDALKRADADIMCLQELISPPQRAVLTHFDHHVCYSGLSHPGNGVGCPWYANIPAVLVASIAGSLWHYQVVHVAVVAALLVVAAVCIRTEISLYLLFSLSFIFSSVFLFFILWM
jgi:exonuclease III